MAGIFSQGGSAGHRYAGWLSEVEAKNFTFGGKVFNGSPSAIYVGSNLVWMNGWLEKAARQAIMDAFLDDGMAVIIATNAYLDQLAASGQAGKDKATALAGFINEDPMMVCSLGLEPQLTVLPKMPWRFAIGGNGNYADSGVYGTENTRVIFKGIIPVSPSEMAVPFGADKTYNAMNFTAWLRYQGNKDTICYGHQYVPGKNNTPVATPFVLDANKENWSETLADGTVNWTNTFNVPSSYSTPGTMTILAFKRNSGVYRPSGTSTIGCCSLEIYQGNSHWNFMPYMNNGVLEFIDIESGNLATRVGTFTEAFYLPDGTPWTPSTP